MSALTTSEARRAVEHVQATWPKASREELLGLPPNERDTLLLLAGELGAVPVDGDGYPLKRRGVE